MLARFTQSLMNCILKVMKMFKVNTMSLLKKETTKDQ
jgi:hypothetical protein